VCIQSIPEVPNANLLGDFNAKVGRKYIFKSLIRNKSLHEISNDNRVTVVTITVK
jgi:hypothetical protein